MHYYQHHIGDYRRDTASLTLTQHGVYRLLMDEYYATGKALSLDEAKLCRAIRAFSKSEKEAVSFILSEFFCECADGFHHKRIDDEIERHDYQRTKASEAGKASAAKRNAKKEPNESSTGVERSLNSGGNESSTKSQPPNTHKPITNNTPLTPQGGDGGFLSLETQPSRPAADQRKARNPQPPDPRHAEFIKAYTEAWQGRFGDKCQVTSADAKQLQQRLRTSQLTVPQLMACVLWCWDENDNNRFATWPVKQAGTIRGFCSNFEAIALAHRNSQAE